MALRSTIATHGFTAHEVLTNRMMHIPKQWWLGGVPPDSYQPRVLMDQFMEKLLNNISDIQKQVAVQLKSNARFMDKRLGDTLKPIEWNIGDRYPYRFYSDKGYVLSPQCAGPVTITNKASPTVYQVELQGKKAKEPHIVPLQPTENMEEVCDLR